MAHELKKKNYSTGSRPFTSGDARVYRFIHRLKPRAKLHSQWTSPLYFFAGKMIATALKKVF